MPCPHGSAAPPGAEHDCLRRMGRGLDDEVTEWLAIDGHQSMSQSRGDQQHIARFEGKARAAHNGAAEPFVRLDLAVAVNFPDKNRDTTIARDDHIVPRLVELYF